MLSLGQNLKLPKRCEKLKGMVGRNGYDLVILGLKGSINKRKIKQRLMWIIDQCLFKECNKPFSDCAEHKTA